MDRTHRAALLAAAIGLASFGGLGVLLGFDEVASLVTGAIMGLLFGGLVIGAARRADSFHPDGPHPGVDPRSATPVDGGVPRNAREREDRP